MLNTLRNNFLYSQAKKFVESVPAVVKSDLIKEEAETLVKSLEAAGGKAEMD